MAYHTTANGEIYIEQNGVDVLLLQDTAAAILNEKDARIAELESENAALRCDKKTFPISTHNGLHIYSDADAVEGKIVSLEAELSAALEDARSLANFIDYHCVEDMPDALTREIVNKYTGTSDAALGK